MLVCANCGRENSDPMVDVTGWTCGYCHAGPLVRLPNRAQLPPPPHPQGPDPARIVVAGALGAAVGGVLLGPLGAAIGGVVGGLFGARQP